MKIPKPGSVIRILVKNPLARGMIPPGPDYQEYRGRVLEPYRWLTAREFCLSGDQAWPIRVINMDLVESMDLESGSTADVDTGPRVWQVQGSKGSVYTVTQTESKLSCTCPGFQFRRNCRHITEIKAA